MGGDYSYASDLWSVGLCFATCALGKIPSRKRTTRWAVVRAICDGDPPRVDPKDGHDAQLVTRRTPAYDGTRRRGRRRSSSWITPSCAGASPSTPRPRRKRQKSSPNHPNRRPGASASRCGTSPTTTPVPKRRGPGPRGPRAQGDGLAADAASSSNGRHIGRRGASAALRLDRRPARGARGAALHTPVMEVKAAFEAGDEAALQLGGRAAAVAARTHGAAIRTCLLSRCRTCSSERRTRRRRLVLQRRRRPRDVASPSPPHARRLDTELAVPVVVRMTSRRPSSVTAAHDAVNRALLPPKFASTRWPAASSGLYRKARAAPAPPGEAEHLPRARRRGGPRGALTAIRSRLWRGRRRPRGLRRLHPCRRCRRDARRGRRRGRRRRVVAETGRRRRRRPRRQRHALAPVRPGQRPRRRGLDEDRAEGVPVVHGIGQIEGQLAGQRAALDGGGGGAAYKAHKIATSITRRLGQLLGSVKSGRRARPAPATARRLARCLHRHLLRRAPRRTTRRRRRGAHLHTRASHWSLSSCWRDRRVFGRQRPLVGRRRGPLLAPLPRGRPRRRRRPSNRALLISAFVLPWSSLAASRTRPASSLEAHFLFSQDGRPLALCRRI